MTIEERLEHFQHCTMEHSREESEKVLEEYQQMLDKIFEEHKAEKEMKARQQIANETEKLRRQMNKDLSMKQVAIKRNLSKRSMELEGMIFSEVKNELAYFTETSAYVELLVKEIQEALEFADGKKIIIYIDPADSEKRFNLQQRTGASITVSEYSFKGGMRAVIPEKHILIDNSFESKLEEADKKFSFTKGAANE